jgi:hypothetical protein
MADATDPQTMANNTEPSSAMETKKQPLTINVARVLLLYRSFQRGWHNRGDPWIALPLQLHEYDNLLLRIDKKEWLSGWVQNKAKFVHNYGDVVISGSYAYLQS